MYFGSAQFMGDANLVWQAVRWAIYRDFSCPVGLQLGRQKSVFISRCDMDMTKYINSFQTATEALYNNFVSPWKESYNFVGTYFINIGNDPESGEYTDWSQSRPLYQAYIDKGNEIGSHSYTHPFFVNNLSEEELIFEFNTAQQEIQTRLSLDRIGTAQATWQP